MTEVCWLPSCIRHLAAASYVDAVCGVAKTIRDDGETVLQWRETKRVHQTTCQEPCSCLRPWERLSSQVKALERDHIGGPVQNPALGKQPWENGRIMHVLVEGTCQS